MSDSLQTFRDSWDFVSMEYYWLMLNRTYKIFVNDTTICGIKVYGIRAAPTSISKIWEYPEFYVNTSMLNKYEGINIFSEEFLSIHRANFQYRINDIVHVEFINKKKWGMGLIPHSGILNILFDNNQKREFILLGSQDGNSIAKRLKVNLQKNFTFQNKI